MSGRTKILSKTNPVQKLSSSSRINSMLTKSANIIQSAQHVINKQNERLKTSSSDRPSGIRVLSPRLKSFPAEEIRKSRPTRSCEFISETPKLNEKRVKNLSTTQIKSNNNKVLSQQQQQQQRSTNPSSNESNNRVLYFTPAMIHDQELLVSTLRQHGINEDIMKRQFDSLLAEQKKQLFYLDQLQNHEVDSPSDTKNNTQQRKRISRLDDGKPEWMARITPPWISYATLDNEINNSNSQMHDIRPNEQVFCQPDGNSYEPQQHQQERPEIGFTHQHYNQNPNAHTQNSDTDISTRVCDHNNDNHTGTRSKSCSSNANNSRLPVRVYNDIMKKQKQNNGLQDRETIKLAMELLKNPQHQKGLEYVEKLNRKSEIVKLNGVQDPDETNQNYSNIVDNKINTKICANGLENTRNSNNPILASLLQHKKKFNEPVYSEYPRRKISSVMLPTERENGAIANSVIHDNQHYAPLIQNSQTGRPTADCTMTNDSPQQTLDVHQVQASATEPHNCRRVSFNIDNSPQVVSATDCVMANHAQNHQQQNVHQVQESEPEHHECYRVPFDINTPRSVGGTDCTLSNYFHNHQPQNIHQVQQNEHEPHQCHRVPFNHNQPQVVDTPDCTMTNHPHHHQSQDIYQTQEVESEPHQCRRVSFNTNRPQAVDTTNYHPHQTQDVYKIQGNELEHHEYCRVPFNTNQAQEQIMQNHNQKFQAILEPKIIGGVQYFTIKPAYFPNNNSTHQ